MISILNKKRLNMFFSGLLMAGDSLVIFFALFLSYEVRFHSNFFSTPLGIPSLDHYYLPVLWIAVLLILVMNSQSLYRPDPTKKFIDYFFSIFKSVGITMLFVLAGTFFYRERAYSRSLIFITWVNLVILLAFSRYLLGIFYKRRILPKTRKRIIIVGKPESMEIIKSHERYFRQYGDIVGVVSSRKVTQEYPILMKNLGSIENFEEVLNAVKPDEVILSDLELPRKKIIAMILESEKRLVTFKIVADLFDVLIQQFEVENINGLNLIRIKESPLNYAHNRFLKRVVDFLASGIGIVAISPFLALVAIIVKLDSRGMVLFLQERVTEGGRIFKIYKFRTMRPEAEVQTGPVFAQENDERCTRIGRFLRMYNIDELPQLFNVLKGDMSLVGPRPERPYFVDQFKDGIPRYMSRHHIKAGMTGWAQVNGFRQGTPIESRVKYDLYYAENWSIWFDLKIILMSLFALKNAY
ncbi:MAG: sugar transferase [Candidatus Omnitrophota bacterium]|nr:sugar transferase [Candidatus Omnitrophota bacterium]